MNNKYKVWCKVKNEWETDQILLSEDGIIFHLRNGVITTVTDTHIICWSTGLKDKNGTEIFEGDILKTGKRWISKVYWLESHAEFQHKWNEGSKFNDTNEFWINEPLWKQLGSIEVIGSIYENAEFLEAK